MAIGGLRRLSLGRGSLIGVKRLFFRGEQDKVECFVRFVDGFTLSYVTLFMLVRFYMETGSAGLDHQEEVLTRVIKYLRRKREEFLIYQRFHSFRDAISRFYMPLVVALKEFRGFVDVDLCEGMKNMDRNTILDMYNCDLYLFITKIIPSITTVVGHLKKVIDGYDSLDMYLVGVNTMIISESSNKIKRIIDINQPLVIKYLTNNITISQFHIQRNESSLEHLTLDETYESMINGETFFGNQLITVESYQKFIISDSIYILGKLAYQITSIINNVDSSMEYFLTLSDFLETRLNDCYSAFQNIRLDPFGQVTEHLITSCESMMSIVTKSQELIEKSIELPEFQKLSPLLKQNKLKFNVINIIYQLFKIILESTTRVDELDRTDKFQHRFKVSIDSLSCGVLGLESSIDSFVDVL